MRSAVSKDGGNASSAGGAILRRDLLFGGSRRSIECDPHQGRHPRVQHEYLDHPRSPGLLAVQSIEQKSYLFVHGVAVLVVRANSYAHFSQAAPAEPLPRGHSASRLSSHSDVRGGWTLAREVRLREGSPQQRYLETCVGGNAWELRPHDGCPPAQTLSAGCVANRLPLILVGHCR